VTKHPQQVLELELLALGHDLQRGGGQSSRIVKIDYAVLDDAAQGFSDEGLLLRFAVACVLGVWSSMFLHVWFFPQLR